ncbi:MAG: YbaB/EbfC family nucleoid-associated protein [Gemmatimonadetes bacterium]|nr:YbaB/EbfC family nucleoid-associated protein [Gemmatimonadota bacterium]NIR80483.1 YbaB/EbfC family nucleoid-associated protein [Gemmatimonadota bacterium]NIT89244.1 YbaB/EbfC family nucleoid-associated protein [Gemmatimonadota bacterium]NIU33043.1 YbaB/EbfC family nucleoid-associated protein [Gemmatimonadota bacterium]NIU37424.1 YbaB/EbfC family nucleoid-associated protein [Gemmatimonadota bacterium]
MNNSLQQLMQMGQKLQTKMTEVQEKLDHEEVSASAGGGMVTATADGKGHVKSVRIDPAVVDPEDVEMLEDLVLAAISEAQNKASQVYEEEMKKISGGFPLPFQLPGLF